MSSTEEVVNEYEALRLAKIARNEARLRELGLHKNPWKQTENNKNCPTPPDRYTVAAGKAAPVIPLRRSKRSRGSINADEAPVEAMGNRSSPNTGEEDTPTVNDQEYHPRKDRDNSDTEISNSHTFNSKRSTNTRSKPASVISLPPNSARVMTMNVDKLLTDSLIGKTLSQSGKAHVMEESARLAVHGYSGHPISFNKYSGLQEWGNDVIFLWINLDGPNSDVTNDFPKNGQQVTWYGGSRMHEGTPAIQRLLSVGLNPPLGAGIVLWCRRYLKERKTFEPYTCLGRLSYVSHEPQSHPLAFVWKLDDFNRIMTHNYKERRDKFEAMVVRKT